MQSRGPQTPLMPRHAVAEQRKAKATRRAPYTLAAPAPARCAAFPPPGAVSQVHLRHQPPADVLELPRVAGHPRQPQRVPSTSVELHELSLKAEALGLAAHHEVRGLPMADAVGSNGPEHLLHDVLGAVPGAAAHLQGARAVAAVAFTRA
eukprot:CAMPEP_0171262804 /NCGR_PEP_ID=MMETSP0790-20130122/56762_1 /TAXON_ID=2925 /ORGANISM="Alexandrium catenella, Strain OF101" /LENGTH=149 /DNA_ID=CAMNT_0011731381 /DNA_START=6 /DNA_END=455 /DNA_ORIENTATION=+